MIIKLWPSRSDSTLSVVKYGDVLVLNGTSLDFSQLEDGSTLPDGAISSELVLQPVERIDGELVITLILPFAADAPESARYPVDIFNPADGVVRLPGIDDGPAQQPTVSGFIDWSQVVTRAMKDQAAADQRLAEVVADSAARRAVADSAIAPLQDAVDLDDATDAEVAALKEWKKYRVALSRVTEQADYPNTIVWPVTPD